MEEGLETEAEQGARAEPMDQGGRAEQAEQVDRAVLVYHETTTEEQDTSKALQTKLKTTTMKPAEKVITKAEQNVQETTMSEKVELKTIVEQAGLKTMVELKQKAQIKMVSSAITGRPESSETASLAVTGQAKGSKMASLSITRQAENSGRVADPSGGSLAVAWSLESL